MISNEMYRRVAAAIKEYWHYNDEGKAYTPESWTAFMQQYSYVNRTFFKNNKGYETLANAYKRTGIAAQPEDLPTEIDPAEDAKAADALEKLETLRSALVQTCDPHAIKIPLWQVDNIPDMRRNESLSIVCSDATATPSLDPEDYMPSFVPYWIEDGKAHPIILVFAGGHRGNHTSGDPVCRFFNSIGYHAAVMGHRVGIQKLNFCLDLQRAIRYLRYHADKLHICPNQIGAIGLSFGGVVITDYIEQLRYSDLPSRYDPSYQPDDIDAMPGELNAFLGVYTSSDPFLKRSEDLDYSQYPPTFLVQPGADQMIAFQISYLNDLIQHGVRVESHMFDGGIHGFGLGDGEIVPNGENGTFIPAIALWPKLAELWLARIFQ